MKTHLYQWMVHQLQQDGYSGAAMAVREAAAVQPLSEDDLRRGGSLLTFINASTSSSASASAAAAIDPWATAGLTDVQEADSSAAAPVYSTAFITNNRDAVISAAFSADGKYAAIGSSDTSIKLLSTVTMRYFNSIREQTQMKPVLLSFYEHSGAVTALDFHPKSPVFASGSVDATIRLYDFSREPSVAAGGGGGGGGGGSGFGAAAAAARKPETSFMVLKDGAPVRAVQFHPSGTLLLVGGDHHALRIFDLNTQRCFTVPDASAQHGKAINSISFTWDGQRFATASLDGSVRVWDSRTFALLHVLPFAHGGAEVYGARFCRSGRYLLTTGRDSAVRLFDTTSWQQVRAFFGTTHNQSRCAAVFSQSEQFVISNDEASAQAVLFRVRTGAKVQQLHGHNQAIRFIAVSPNSDDMLTCSDDSRCRFWTVQDE